MRHGIVPGRTNSSSGAMGRLRKAGGDGPSFCSIRFLLLLAAVVTIANYFFPDEVALVEHEMAQDIYNAEQMAEHVVMDFWGGGDSHPLRPIPEHEHPDFAETSEQATKRMLEQDSKWVDGEKKLKAKLKVLAQRQAEGKDIGVPVLTRYLGEDIPAWPSEGMDEKTWKAKVDAKYAEMREEEEQWKARMHGLLKQHQHG